MTAKRMPRQRAVAWTKDAPVGAELAIVELDGDRLSATGTAIGSAPEPYRLDYELHTGAGFVTRSVRVTTAGQGWTRRLQLEHDGSGRWTCETEQVGEPALPDPGGETSHFVGALDPDLGLSPLFNSMPVLRHGLVESGSGTHDFLMVWISVPDLRLHPSRQRYSHVSAAADVPAVVRFESLDDGTEFCAQVQFDDDGLVVDYPQVATRIRRGGPA